MYFFYLNSRIVTRYVAVGVNSPWLLLLGISLTLSFPLQDDECAEGLECLQRRENTPVPDYCVGDLPDDPLDFCVKIGDGGVVDEGGLV